MKAILLIAYVIIIVFLITSPSLALMIPLSTEELADKSEVVIKGKVDDVQGKWSRDKNLIVTQVSVIIDKIYKGKLDEEKVVVEFDGGEVDGVGFGVSDSARFNKGEEVLLFLKPAQSKVKGMIYNLIGSAQGKYSIDENGIAHKEGFSVFIEKDEDKSIIDNDVPLDSLLRKMGYEPGHAFIWIDRGKKGKKKNKK